jgi:hypothetical protein
MRARIGRYASVGRCLSWHHAAMKWLEVRIVDGLELACRGTRFVEWLPGWHRVYPQCLFARWSSQLDARWRTNRWPVHDEDGVSAWKRWWDALPDEERSSGHWHHWKREPIGSSVRG